MVVLGSVIFISFIACLVGMFGLFSNCLFEFGIDPAARKLINWSKLTFGKKYVEIYVHPATDEQLDLAVKQEMEDLGLTSKKGIKSSLKRCDNAFGGMPLKVPADEPLPDNFVGYVKK